MHKWKLTVLVADNIFVCQRLDRQSCGLPFVLSSHTWVDVISNVKLDAHVLNWKYQLLVCWLKGWHRTRCPTYHWYVGQKLEKTIGQNYILLCMYFYFLCVHCVSLVGQHQNYCTGTKQIWSILHPSSFHVCVHWYIHSFLSEQ